ARVGGDGQDVAAGADGGAGGARRGVVQRRGVGVVAGGEGVNGGAGGVAAAVPFVDAARGQDEEPGAAVALEPLVLHPAPVVVEVAVAVEAVLLLQRVGEADRLAGVGEGVAAAVGGRQGNRQGTAGGHRLVGRLRQAHGGGAVDEVEPVIRRP